MILKKTLLFLTFLAVPLFSGCESLKNAFGSRGNKPPPLIVAGSETPTLEQLTSAINRNSMMIRNMSSEDASIQVPGSLLSLRSKIVLERAGSERPRRLRIQSGATALTGRELDFGSNETLFWLWIKRNPGEMYYCRHDQFATSPLRTMVPIEPDWVIEALGVMEFHPNELHEGPFPTEDGNLMIVSRRQTESGQFLKRTVVGSKTGWVLRQEMYSPQNELVAMALLSDHRYDKGSGVLYAGRIEVQCQGAEGKMTINLGTPRFNVQTPFSSTMFTMPHYDGYKPIDLCGTEFSPNRAGIVTPIPLNGSMTNTTAPGMSAPALRYQEPAGTIPSAYAPPTGPAIPETIPSTAQTTYPTGPITPGASFETVVR